MHSSRFLLVDSRFRTTSALVMSLSLCVPAVAQDGDVVTPTPPTPPLPVLDEIQKAVASIRGLEFKHEVPSEKQAIEDFRAYVEHELESVYPPERVEGMMQGLVRLGLLSKPLDLGGAFVTGLITQAAAYYDPVADKFYYLMADMPLMALEAVAAHELVHALQDQHFDLGTLMTAMEAPADIATPRNDDLIHAIRFLVEGEATYVQTIWQLKDMAGMDITANPNLEAVQFRTMASMDIDTLTEMAKNQAPGGMMDDPVMKESIEAMKQLPRYILAPMYAAYFQGAYFVMSLRHAGGWEKVAATWKDLPCSTEQVLHPEKYTGETRDLPTTLALPDTAFLDAAGWIPIDSAIHGELLLNLLLREQGQPKAIADKATSGWDGDLYAAWRQGDDGPIMMTLSTVWDTEADATEFFNTYKAALATKYPGLQIDREEADNHIFFSCGEGGGGDGGRAEGLGEGVLMREGQRVFTVEGGDRPTVDRLAKAIREQTVNVVE